jgi:hypothetical protein
MVDLKVWLTVSPLYYTNGTSIAFLKISVRALRHAFIALVAIIRELNIVCLILYFERLKALRLTPKLKWKFYFLLACS